MNATRDAAPLAPMTTSGGGPQDRGAEIGRRFEALGLSDRKWHEETGIDRKTLNRAIDNYPGTRRGTYDAIEANLDKLEAKYRAQAVAMKKHDPESSPDIEVGPAEDHGGYIRFELQGVYGAKAMIVSAPVGNPEELATAVDLIMRRLREDEAASTDEA